MKCEEKEKDESITLNAQINMNIKDLF